MVWVDVPNSPSVPKDLEITNPAQPIFGKPCFVINENVNKLPEDINHNQIRPTFDLSDASGGRRTAQVELSGGQRQLQTSTCVNASNFESLEGRLEAQDRLKTGTFRNTNRVNNNNPPSAKLTEDNHYLCSNNGNGSEEDIYLDYRSFETKHYTKRDAKICDLYNDSVRESNVLQKKTPKECNFSQKVANYSGLYAKAAECSDRERAGSGEAAKPVIGNLVTCQDNTHASQHQLFYPPRCNQTDDDEDAGYDEPEDQVDDSFLIQEDVRVIIPSFDDLTLNDLSPLLEGSFPVGSSSLRGKASAGRRDSDRHSSEHLPRQKLFELLPLGCERDRRKSRGILASCQVPESVGRFPDVLQHLREIHRRSSSNSTLLKDTYYNNFPLRLAYSRDPSLKSLYRKAVSIPAPRVNKDEKLQRSGTFHHNGPSPKCSPVNFTPLKYAPLKNSFLKEAPPSSQGLELTCESPESPDSGRGSARPSVEEEALGPQFFADLCSMWPDLIVRLAHDISLESPSVEEAPDPPDPPSLEEVSDDLNSQRSLSTCRLRTTSTSSSSGKCCSDDDPCCPQLMVEQTQELRAAAACKSAQMLASNGAAGPCLSAGVQPASCPSPICGSPAPRRPRPTTVSSGPSSVESVDSSDTGDASEFFSGDLEELIESMSPPDCDLEDAARACMPWDPRPNERKRRKLPEIPKHKKSFSTASILALRTPTLAEELQEAESGVASRSSTPDALTLINTHSKPILVLKCHSYIRDDSSSPDSELRLPINDIDSGNSTQHSPDGAKSMSPQATVNGSLSPMSPGSAGVPFPQLELLEATHRGLYRFIPRHHDEVDIEIGDPIYVQKEAEDLWCEGVNIRTGRQGIFPAAHVTDVDYSDFDPTVPKVKKERYLLNYLGSIETLCHKGNQVLCQAVRKIAGGEESAHLPHPCILEVSDQGIRMVDKRRPTPNHAPCHDYFYHLKHVSFCAFHPKDHRYFGFITKHPTIQRFACHVFRSNDSTRPVAEAVGRAFQRFYQKFIETAYPIEDIYLE
nr:uncharacterized protein LOC123762632 [Procambarus clarkii]